MRSAIQLRRQTLDFVPGGIGQGLEGLLRFSETLIDKVKRCVKSLSNNLALAHLFTHFLSQLLDGESLRCDFCMVIT